MQKRIWIGVIFLSLTSATSAPVKKNVSIPVQLFGQPCTLEGPYAQKVLEQIHAISPAEFPPFTNEKEAQGAVQKFSSANDIPSALNDYRSRFKKNAEAHEQFFLSLKMRDTQKVLEAIRPFVQGRNMSEFKMRLDFYLKKSDTAGFDSMLESLQALIESRPEPEFHRVIQRLKVIYHCSFDERTGDENAGDEHDHEIEAEPPVKKSPKKTKAKK